MKRNFYSNFWKSRSSHFKSLNNNSTSLTALNARFNLKSREFCSGQFSEWIKFITSLGWENHATVAAISGAVIATCGVTLGTYFTLKTQMRLQTLNTLDNIWKEYHKLWLENRNLLDQFIASEIHIKLYLFSSKVTSKDNKEYRDRQRILIRQIKQNERLKNRIIEIKDDFSKSDRKIKERAEKILQDLKHQAIVLNLAREVDNASYSHKKHNYDEAKKCAEGVILKILEFLTKDKEKVEGFNSIVARVVDALPKQDEEFVNYLRIIVAHVCNLYGRLIRASVDWLGWGEALESYFNGLAVLKEIKSYYKHYHHEAGLLSNIGMLLSEIGERVFEEAAHYPNFDNEKTKVKTPKPSLFEINKWLKNLKLCLKSCKENEVTLVYRLKILIDLHNTCHETALDYHKKAATTEPYSNILKNYGEGLRYLSRYSDIEESKKMEYRKEAEILFTKAWSLDQEYPTPLIHRGMLKADLKDYSGAIQDFDEAGRKVRHHDNIWLLYHRGAVLIEANRYEEAKRDLDKAQSLLKLESANTPEQQRLLGRVGALLGKLSSLTLNELVLLEKEICQDPNKQKEGLSQEANNISLTHFNRFEKS